jgi:hypothetical protein
MRASSERKGIKRFNTENEVFQYRCEHQSERGVLAQEWILLDTLAVDVPFAIERSTFPRIPTEMPEQPIFMRGRVQAPPAWTILVVKS